MSEKSLAEVVEQLDGPSQQDEPLDGSIAPLERTELQSSLLEGLRATEWMLSDLRERCRQLHGYRLHMLGQLQRLVDAEDSGGESGIGGEYLVPGPLTPQ